MWLKYVCVCIFICILYKYECVSVCVYVCVNLLKTYYQLELVIIYWLIKIIHKKILIFSNRYKSQLYIVTHTKPTNIYLLSIIIYFYLLVFPSDFMKKVFF